MYISGQIPITEDGTLLTGKARFSGILAFGAYVNRRSCKQMQAAKADI